jgi:hypothetical protein
MDNGSGVEEFVFLSDYLQNKKDRVGLGIIMDDEDYGVSPIAKTLPTLELMRQVGLKITQWAGMNILVSENLPDDCVLLVPSHPIITLPDVLRRECLKEIATVYGVPAEYLGHILDIGTQDVSG